LGSSDPGRVAIIYPRANIDTVPSLSGAVELLARRGFEVDVYALTGAGSAPVFPSPRVHVWSLGSDAGAPRRAPAALRGLFDRTGWLGRALRRPVANGYRALRAAAARGTPASPPGVPPGGEGAGGGVGTPVCFIGVDPDGLALADRLRRGTGAALAYYSLELLPTDELRTESDRHLKQVEVELSRRAAFVVVQDAARGRLLAQDNGLDWDRLVFVPNAPFGPARRRPSDYWRDRFGLDPRQRVVLHAGSLGAWTGIDRVVDSVRSWPAEWVLVVHTRYDAESSPYVEQLQRRAPAGRVFFSLKPVPRADYDALADGADAALALYVRSAESALTGRNVETIGLSSGKLAYALRAGVPVIVHRATSVAELVEREGCGVVVGDAADIGPALGRIAAEGEDMSRRACALFERELDVERAFDAVVRRLGALADAAGVA
jgi:glycosyltransferase involved in cell wall biosynthesis